MMMADDTILLCAKRLDGALRLEVEVIGAQADDCTGQCFESMRQQQQLARRVDAGSLATLRVPRVSDLDPIGCRHDIVIARAARDGVGGEVAYCPRQHVTGALSLERSVDVAARTRWLGYRGKPELP